MSKRRKGSKPSKGAAPASRARAAEPQRGDERLVAALDEGSGSTELWVRAADLMLFGFIGLIIYLGSRPGGNGPVYAYRYGQMMLGMLSLVILCWGVIVCFRKPPLRRKGRIRGLVALVLVIGIGMNSFPYPSSREREPSAVRFELPVEREWRVYWGGEGSDYNRYAGWFPDRRWALALVQEVNGRTHSDPDGSTGPVYFAEEELVLAPAAGTVVGLVDGQPDRSVFDSGPAEEPFGNHLVIQVAEGEYLFLCHLLAGSFRVGVGDRVETGDELAQVGRSGHSTVVDEPHLELHLQTTPVAGLGEAIPWSFHDYMVGDKLVEAGLPRGGVASDGRLTGQLVRRAPR